MTSRRVYYVSDRTGLTAENIGDALLEQFSDLTFLCTTCPFVDTVEKAHHLVKEINETAKTCRFRPLIIYSVVNNEIREIIKTAQGLHLNFFESFLGKLEEEFGQAAKHAVESRAYDVVKYDARMEAVNFALNHDDGISDRELQEADVILMGVSRSGKTPTCLYLALQYGIRAANYPLTPDDLDTDDLPRMVKNYRNKLFGLTIQPERLHQIRQERRPNSTYSALNTCKQEVSDAQAIFRRHGIPFANTTHKSVEELAVHILQECHLTRKY